MLNVVGIVLWSLNGAPAVGIQKDFPDMDTCLAEMHQVLKNVTPVLIEQGLTGLSWECKPKGEPV